MEEGLIEYLTQFITKERLHLFNQIINHRTRYFTVVLEDIYQPHNASAVMRSCDGFGIQDVHIIENNNTYNDNPEVSLGSSKWLSLYKYHNNENNTISAINHLKEKGYRIVATAPVIEGVPLEEFNILNGKAAFLFGTELTGLSQQAFEHSDEKLAIPMYGFSESFNISVSVALVLHYVSHSLRNADINWHLTEGEKKEIMLQWLKSSIKSADHIEKYYLNK